MKWFKPWQVIRLNVDIHHWKKRHTVCVHFGFYKWNEWVAVSTTELEMVFSLLLHNCQLFIQFHIFQGHQSFGSSIKFTLYSQGRSLTSVYMLQSISLPTEGKNVGTLGEGEAVSHLWEQSNQKNQRFGYSSSSSHPNTVKKVWLLKFIIEPWLEFNFPLASLMHFPGGNSRWLYLSDNIYFGYVKICF